MARRLGCSCVSKFDQPSKTSTFFRAGMVDSTLGEVLVQYRCPQLSMELNKAMVKKQNEGEVLTPAGLLPVLKELAKGTSTEERMTDCPSSPFCSFQNASWLKTYVLFFLKNVLKCQLLL